MGYLYIFATIAFTVYGQLVLKWRIVDYGSLPDGMVAKFVFLVSLLMDPFILSGFISAFIASLFWMAAMTRFEISYAYPFMSLSFVCVFVLSVVLFNEGFSPYKLLGLILIMSGILVTSRAT